MAAGHRRARKVWEDFSDEELLDLRFSELKLSLERGPLAPPVARLHTELESAGVAFRPHVWISSEWFSPDGVAGLAVPFFLAHPRLTALERRQMSYVEGGGPEECMRLLRHEAGHAIDTAYGFFRRAGYRELFGRTRSPYNSYYSPRPSSRAYVHNLARWYAQSHPSEDFAETFAVWLNPRSRWRQRYAGVPALDKLVYVDDLMHEVGSRSPRRVIRERVESLPQLTETLSEHYVLKRRHYSFGRSKFYDSALVKLFPPPRPYQRAERASVFMTRQRTQIVDLALAGARFDRYSVCQGLFEMVLRSRRLGLRSPALPARAVCQATARLVLAFLERLEQGRHRLVR